MLKAWRKTRYKTQQEAADAFGVTRRTFVRYEQSEELPDNVIKKYGSLEQIFIAESMVKFSRACLDMANYRYALDHGITK